MPQKRGHPPPPPTRYGSPTVQAKTAPVARHPAPPPTRFGPVSPIQPKPAIPSRPATPPLPTGRAGTIQRMLPQQPPINCQYCWDPACFQGSKCGRDVSFGGLFSPGTTSPYVGPHKDTKKYSKRGVYESEHVTPKNALVKGGVNFTYNNEITISIPYGMHRGGQSGAGGGVSSTGSSGTASGWSDLLGNMLQQGDWPGAIRAVLLDELHSAAQNGALDQGMMSAFLQYLQNARMQGRISANDVEQIYSALYGSYANYLQRGIAK